MGEALEAENFLYNAPQYCNLSTANTEDDSQVEEYFNFNHENVTCQYEDVSSDDDSKQPFYTPLKLDTLIPQNQTSNLRKSLSMGNLLPPPKTNMVFRPMSKDRLNMLAQPKPRITQSSFISSAELINKFHQKTPKRFRTTSARAQAKPAQPSIRSDSLDSTSTEKASAVSLVKCMGPTIPQSPALATGSRSRPTMYMPRDIREEQEMEDMKKLQIKAMPVPKTNYGPAIPVKVDRRPSTVVQPFNLTKIAPKKLLVPELRPIEFHAKPLPKNIVQKDLNETKIKPLKAIHTKPVPFSFQTRQDEMLKKRVELINKVMEEEKKKREFHAQPVPKSVYKSPIKGGIKSARSKENIGPSNNCSAKSSITNLSNTTLFSKNGNDVSFKAKPADVLKKRPFIPKLNLLPLTAISSFNLNTERRVAEREAYELKIREKEEILADLENARAQQQEQKEKAEVALLRKQMEIKANPIRHFKPLLPISPKPLTIPDTPKFVQRNKNVDQSD